ncbi:MAG: autorepressor SdpR family transcription factor [Erysipelotrichaceae bacterium]
MSIQNSFKAMSDQTRRDILELLKTGSMNATDISDSFKLSNATVSHHLNILKDANLILDEKKGKYIYYTLNCTVLDELLLFIKNLGGSSYEE